MFVKNISDVSFIKSHIDFERYVRVHSRSFSEIYHDSLKKTDDHNSLEGIVSIYSIESNKTIYRKLVGGHVNSGDVEMGYRTQCELKVREGENVDIKPANWFCYYWCNSDSYLKHPFRIAFFSAVITMFSFIIGIVSLIYTILS